MLDADTLVGCPRKNRILVFFSFFHKIIFGQKIMRGQKFVPVIVLLPRQGSGRRILLHLQIVSIEEGAMFQFCFAPNTKSSDSAFEK